MPASQDNRRYWMGVLARANVVMLVELMKAAEINEPFQMLRAPETGLVMVRGRMGGEGAPFNVGEITVTRCSVTLSSGAIGHSMTMGRDAMHAVNAALMDALLQDDVRRESLLRFVIHPLADAEAMARARSTRKSAATKVDFFTVARGEDAV